MDTEGNFRPERVEAIAERFGLDPSETLENVIVTRVFNHEQQIERARVSILFCSVLFVLLYSTSSFAARLIVGSREGCLFSLFFVFFCTTTRRILSSLLFGLPSDEMRMVVLSSPPIPCTSLHLSVYVGSSSRVWQTGVRPLGRFVLYAESIEVRMHATNRF